MNSPNDDQELLRLLANSAAEVNYSPDALIKRRCVLAGQHFELAANK
jgi:hypothetical protein